MRRSILGFAFLLGLWVACTPGVQRFEGIAGADDDDDGMTTPTASAEIASASATDTTSTTPSETPTPGGIVPGPDYSFAVIREDTSNIANFLPDYRDTRMQLRISGAGLGGMNLRQLRAGVYHHGANGRFDEGWGDDQLVLIPWDTTWSLQSFTRIDDSSNNPPIVAIGGLMSAGITTGVAEVRAEHAVWGQAAATLGVTAPDWCPGDFQCL